MPIGISMHFAVRAPGVGCCSRTVLGGPEGDALAMAAVAQQAGFWVWGPFSGRQVTTSCVLGGLRQAAGLLKSGDFLLLTYSGHGCQVLDISGDAELDGYDETWCLSDGQVGDDDLHREFARFDSGVRIVVVSESCHSGILKGNDLNRSRAIPADAETIATWLGMRPRVIDARQGQWQLSRELQPLILPRRAARAVIRADVMLIAACADREQAEDRGTNGLFTETLVRTLRQFPPLGTFEELVKAVHDAVALENPQQHPGISLAGGRTLDLPSHPPFKI